MGWCLSMSLFDGGMGYLSPVAQLKRSTLSVFAIFPSASPFLNAAYVAAPSIVIGSLKSSMPMTIEREAMYATWRACYDAVREVLDRELEPLTPRIAEQIWNSVKPLLGRRQRPS